MTYTLALGCLWNGIFREIVSQVECRTRVKIRGSGNRRARTDGGGGGVEIKQEMEVIPYRGQSHHKENTIGRYAIFYLHLFILST